MVELVVVSGKGGTGKTSVVAALAFSLRPDSQVLVDCDVDAADLFLVLDPTVHETHSFRSGAKAVISAAHCVRCSRCSDSCRFDAISKAFVVNPIRCEGCGACSVVCQNGAVSMRETVAGEWFLSETRFGPLVHAKLGIAQDNSGKLVATIRTKAKECAFQSNARLILVDGPPGIGCPVISSISGASAILIVTEPSPSGIHDLHRLCKLAEHFHVRMLVCVNKFDIHQANTAEIESFCREHGLPLVGKIPYSLLMNEAQNCGKSIFELDQGRPDVKLMATHFVELRNNVRDHLHMEPL